MAKEAPKKSLYERRREAGQCVQCGVDAGGESKCPPCAQKNQDCRQRAQAERKSKGICQNAGCPNAAIPGKTVCQPCSDKAGATRLRTYYKYKAAGVCGSCGGETDGTIRCKECLDKQRGYSKAFYEKCVAESRCMMCGDPAENGQVRCPACLQKVIDRQRELAQARRDRVFAAYGGPVCVGCGFDNSDVLEMDHIEGGGTRHLKEIGQSRLYKWLEDHNYPKGFRVLCPTCNKLAHKGLLKLPKKTKARKS